MRAFIDVVLLLLVVTGLYLRRHRRRELAVLLVAVNVGLFAVVTVISARHVGVGLAFGLFAVLSLIRLRSEALDHIELSYVFSTLVIALVVGVQRVGFAPSALLAALVVVTLFLVDHPALRVDVRRRSMVLDMVENDEVALRERLTADLGVEIVDLRITEADLVRETTTVELRYVRGTA